MSNPRGVRGIAGEEINKKYEIIEHTADVGLRFFGKTLDSLFVNAACGLFDLIAELEKVEEKESVDFTIEAEGKEELLVRWLSELHFRFEVDRQLFKRFQISKIDEKFLSAKAYGEKYDSERHELKTEIKAVTYHQLKVELSRKGWLAEVIFDV